MRLRSLALSLLLLSTASPAQTRYEWAGGSSGSWTEASNWSPSGVPGAGDTAVIDPGGSIRYAVLTENTTVARLELRGFGGVAGDFDLTISDHFQWEAGGTGLETFRGTGNVILGSGATGHMAEGTSRFQMATGRTLVNNGTLRWDGPGRWNGQWRLVNNGDLALAMSGVDLIVFSSLADAITNTASGVIRRDGSDAARISAGIVNDGTIRVESGTLDLNGFNSTGLTGTGSIVVQSGAELNLSGSANNTQASITGETVTVSSFNGRTVVTGTYDVATTRIVGTAGALWLDAEATISDLVMEGGALGGSGTVTIAGSLGWTGGTMEGSGTTSLGPSIPLTIGGDATIRLGGSRTLRTEGPVTWTGGADLQAGTSTTVFENAGTLTSSGAGERQTGFVTFRNTGTVLHTGGMLRFGGPMHNEGTIRIRGGTLRLNSNGTDTGNYDIAEGGRLEFAFGNRTLTESAVVTGSGAVAFLGGTLTNRAGWRPGTSPGTLAVEGDWPAMEPDGVLEMEVGGLAAGTEFDQLAVSGVFRAGGTLRVTLADGFTPGDGDRFLLIPTGDRARDSFDAVDLPDTTPAGYVQVTTAGVIYGLGTAVSNEETGPALPTALALHPPAPNPARDGLVVRFEVPEAAEVRLAVSDALGREVTVLAEGLRQPGEHEVRLDGARLAAGVYVVVMSTAEHQIARRFTLAR